MRLSLANAVCLGRLTIVALLLSAIAYSTNVSASEPTTMRFDRVAVEDGLSQSSVLAITQDHSGFIWFATENGLDRYDGFAFTHYGHERGNPHALASNFVRDLNLESDGSIWVATDGGGVSRWLPDTDRFENYRHDPANPASLATDRIRTILADNNGSVWIGTRDAGLDRLDVGNGQVTHYRHEPDDDKSISNNDIHALAFDDDGALWIGTDAGISRLDVATGEINRFVADDGDPATSGDNRVRSLLFDHDDVLWVGTNGSGLFRFDTDSQTFTHSKHDPANSSSLSSNRVETIFEDDRRRLWIGTDNGLNLMDKASGAFRVYSNDPTETASISGNSIFSIYQDRGGLLWIGTLTAGLSKWNPRSWSFGHFKPNVKGPNSFSNSNITSFAEDPDGDLWVGTFGGGINIVDHENGSVTQVREDPNNPKSLGDDRVMTMMVDRRGQTWAGTMTGGLSQIDRNGEVIRNFSHDRADPTSLAANGVMALLQDRSSRIWVGTFGGGVSRLDPSTGTFENFTHEPGDATSLSSPRATAIAEDQSGTIWVGTDGGGLNYFDAQGNSWHHLYHAVDDPESLSSDTVYSLHVDARGRLWVGTRNGVDMVSGYLLSVLGGGGLKAAPVGGLPRTAVYGIESDYNGYLWLSTSKGLISYNPDTGEHRVFHASQGLQGEEFNFGASYTGRDGKLYFGGANGFNAFHPVDLELNDIPPPVALTSLSIINEPFASDGPYERIASLDLDHRDDVVTFGIAALDFTSPEQNRYSYQLEGFDDDWVDAGNERRITYTNLDGGDYVLRVRAANSDGVWNDTGIEIPLAVAHPPWKTWWAYVVYMSSLVFGAFAFWRRQQQKLQRELEYSRRLEHEVHDRTKQLNRRNKDLKEVNEKLLEASTTDVLTGLRNRRYLFEQIAKDVDLVLRHYRDGTETMRPGGNNDLLFLMVDLDNFKPVNDNRGHEAGDRLLLQVRDVLLDACRKSDDVIRWGGDEFLIIARETNRDYAANLAERIRSSLAERVFPVGDGHAARISSSIGYASYPFLKERPELLDWEEVLGVADAAMYEAKQKRNAWVGIECIRWADSGEELYRAIKSDPGTLAEEGAIRALESVEEVDEILA